MGIPTLSSTEASRGTGRGHPPAGSRLFMAELGAEDPKLSKKPWTEAAFRSLFTLLLSYGSVTHSTPKSL